MQKNKFSKGLVFGIIILFVGASIIPSMSGTTTELYGENENLAENNFKKRNNDPENAVVCGYVTDKDTGLPIENVEVEIYSWDDDGMNTAEGWIDLHFHPDDYFHEHLWDYFIESYEILWYNVSLFPIPPVTVNIIGYITDINNGKPISSARVNLDWKDDYGHWWDNQTYSNGSGFYHMGGPAGELRIYVYADGYFSEGSDWYIVNENETFWINLSLVPEPPQTAVVCGYITDRMNGEPIEDADVDLQWRDDEGNYDYNYTYTDGIGFYKMRTAPGRIKIYAYKSNYDSQSSQYYWIEDNQTLWINLSLPYEPDESLMACGYVLDTVTCTPIKYAYIRYDWKDDVGHIYSKYTYTDRVGFFQISLPPGSAQFYATSYGYQDFSTSWYVFNESKLITWINVSIEPEISVTIEKPLPGIYINDSLRTPLLSKFLSRFVPNFRPIIIGSITIEVNVTQNTSGVNRVDFYIDDIFHKTDNIKPYNFTWNKTAFFTHSIKVIAYDNSGPINIDTLNIRKFF
jgi:protocatechuate 3,4-dioxygenase beta subunit